MTTPFIIIFSFISLSCFSESIDTISGIFLRNCKTTTYGIDTTTICGIKNDVGKYNIIARAKIKNKTFVNEFIIYTVTDSSCNYLDSIYSEIREYWLEEERHSTKYGYPDDLSAFSIDKGFYEPDSFTIPYISTYYDRVGAFAIIWYNKRVYKIEFSKSCGWGGLTSFFYFNFGLNNNDDFLPLGKLVKKLSVTKDILTRQINCH